MKTLYNDSFNPPAPFLAVQISNLSDVVRSPVTPALVDSGADMTVIPVSLLEQTQLALAGEMWVQSYDGRPEPMPYYDVVLRVGEIQLAGLSVIAFSGDYAILGRDVLNLLRLLLDGPALTLEILPPT